MQKLDAETPSGTQQLGVRKSCFPDPRFLEPLGVSASRRLRQLVPCHRRALMAAIACHFIGPGFNPLPMSTRRANSVCEREDSSEPFDHARLAADDRPPLRRMIADLEKATIDRHVVPVDVEDDNVARGNANDGIPSATPQRVRARRTDASPTLHLQPCRRDHSVNAFHDL
jgi:hypothetical protein